MTMSSYAKSARYGEPFTDKTKKKRSFRRWLRNYISYNNEPIAEVVSASSISSDNKFNKSFEGWTIRLHRANGGHIVEAWKNEDPHAISQNYKREHELFMVHENEDMGTRLNDILIQLMLRG